MKNDDATTYHIEKDAILLDLYKVESDPIVGGMGQVFRIRHTGWNTDLAMKQPKKELFRNEAQKQVFIHECDTWSWAVSALEMFVGARPYLEIFRTLHPTWTDEDFNNILIPDLQRRGYGWLRPEGVRVELDKLTNLKY
jgi:hypothetical protein